MRFCERRDNYCLGFLRPDRFQPDRLCEAFPLSSTSSRTAYLGRSLRCRRLMGCMLVWTGNVFLSRPLTSVVRGTTILARFDSSACRSMAFLEVCSEWYILNPAGGVLCTSSSSPMRREFDTQRMGSVGIVHQVISETKYLDGDFRARVKYKRNGRSACGSSVLSA